MASTRFPGKALAPFNGRPVIAHVIGRVAQVARVDSIVVATSVEPSDDPLVSYVGQLGLPVCRGPLADAFGRFRVCATAYPCDWILRVSADSPLLAPEVIERVIDAASPHDCDLVTTIFPRTFPKGQNAELLRTHTFMAIDSMALTDDDREHVTAYYYRHPDEFRIVNVFSDAPERAALSFAVDTLDDLRRLEELALSGQGDEWRLTAR